MPFLTSTVFCMTDLLYNIDGIINSRIVDDDHVVKTFLCYTCKNSSTGVKDSLNVSFYAEITTCKQQNE